MTTVEILKLRIEAIDKQIKSLEEEREKLFFELDEELGIK
jgi:chaperonin cofactor prefoldin